LLQDPYGQWVISPDYDAQMLAAAVAKHEGFRYAPDPTLWWKQSRSSERDWLLVTTQYVNRSLLDSIQEGMVEGDTLLICCKAFDQKCAALHPAICVKKIPNLLVNRCEYGRDDYSLHIVNVPVDAPEADEWSSNPAEAPAAMGRKIAKQMPDDQQGKLF
jgi:adenine-specific DNA-methyltransferase